MSGMSGPGRVQVARVFGAPVYLHFSWLIIFALIVWSLATGYFPAHYPGLPESSYWVKGLAASLLFFLSILLHEMGHARVAARHGIATRSITLFIFGGVAQLDQEPQDGGAEVKIAAAGPLVSFALAGLAALAARAAFAGLGVRAVAGYLAFINLTLALFNLVPAFPLDGGRLLRGLLWRSIGRARATRVAAGAGTFFAFFLIVAGALALVFGQGIGGVWYILIGFFLKEASQGAWQSARLDEVLDGVRVRDAMLHHIEMLPSHVSLSEAADEYFLKTGYGGYPVERGGQVVGLLCLKDVLRVPLEERPNASVQSVMAPLGEKVVVDADTPLMAALRRMTGGDGGRLLVMQDGQFTGLLTMNSILRHIRVREELRG